MRKEGNELGIEGESMVTERESEKQKMHTK
jgi:hypothetical protein